MLAMMGYHRNIVELLSEQLENSEDLRFGILLAKQCAILKLRIKASISVWINI